MATIVKTDDAFSTLQLTLRYNEVARFPAVRTYMSSYFDIETISDLAAHIDVEEADLPVLSNGVWGQVIPLTQITRERKSFHIGTQKVGKTFDIGLREIQSVRRTAEVTRDSLQSVQDRKVSQTLLAIEDFHERARVRAITKGEVIRADGTVAANMRSSAYYDVPANPVVGLELDAANPAPGALRVKLAQTKRLIDDSVKMGQLQPTGYDVLMNSDAFDLLRWHPETMEAFKRWEDLARPEGSPVVPFTFAGFRFIDYNRTGLESGRGFAMPAGIPGFCKTIFGPGDFIDELNLDGMPRYVSVEDKDHKKGFEYEVSTNVLHFCTRPEAVFEFDAGAGDAPTAP